MCCPQQQQLAQVVMQRNKNKNTSLLNILSHARACLFGSMSHWCLLPGNSACYEPHIPIPHPPCSACRFTSLWNSWMKGISRPNALRADMLLWLWEHIIVHVTVHTAMPALNSAHPPVHVQSFHIKAHGRHIGSVPVRVHWTHAGSSVLRLEVMQNTRVCVFSITSEQGCYLAPFSCIGF